MAVDARRPVLGDWSRTVRDPLDVLRLAFAGAALAFAGDLIADARGSLAGGGLMVLWARRGWGSVRRIPGENEREDASA